MKIQPGRDALLAVDIQHDFLPGGALGVADGDAVIAPVARLAREFAQVGPVVADVPDPAAVTLDQVEATPVRCPDPAAAEKMIQLIEAVRKDQDSVGGVSELVAAGVPGRLE